MFSFGSQHLCLAQGFLVLWILPLPASVWYQLPLTLGPQEMQVCVKAMFIFLCKVASETKERNTCFIPLVIQYLHCVICYGEVIWKICKRQKFTFMWNIHDILFLVLPLPIPEITRISPSQGSTQGGTLLTISGRFFDQTDFPVRVLVGGIFHDF